MKQILYYYHIHQESDLFFRMFCIGEENKPPSNFIRYNERFYECRIFWSRDFGHCDRLEIGRDNETLYRNGNYVSIQWGDSTTEVIERERTNFEGRYGFTKSQIQREKLAWRYIRNKR